MEEKNIENIQESLVTIEALLANVLDSLSEKKEDDSAPSNKSSEQLKEVLVKINELSKPTSKLHQTGSVSNQELAKLISKIDEMLKFNGSGMVWDKSAASLLKTTRLATTKLQKELSQFSLKTPSPGKIIDISKSTRNYSFKLISITVLTAFCSVWFSVFYIDYKTTNADLQLKEAKEINEKYEHAPTPLQLEWHKKYYYYMKEANPNDTRKWQIKNPFPSKK